MKLDEYQKLKAKIDRLQRESDRAQGALDEQTRQLEKEFGCKTVKAAETKLKAMDKEVRKAERELKKVADAFEEKWHKVLEDV